MACASGYFVESRKAREGGSESPPDLYVLKAGNLLELYALGYNKDGTTASRSGMYLVKSVQLGGDVHTICALRSRTPTQRDALAILSEKTQLSVVEYDEQDGSLRTSSLHDFRSYEPITPGRKESASKRGRSLRSDPLGRCLGMLFYGDFLAIVPTAESEGDMLNDVYNDEEEPQANAASGACLEQGSDVLHLSQLGVLFVKDFTFLDGYNEPCLVILHENEPTWSGRLRERKDTCRLHAYSINLHHRRYPRLWSRDNLPYDAFALHPVPASPSYGGSGGVVVLSTNFVMVYNQRSSYAVGVNAYAFTGNARSFPSDPETFLPPPPTNDPMHRMTVANARKNAFQVIPEVTSSLAETAEKKAHLSLELDLAVLVWTPAPPQGQGQGAAASMDASAVLVTRSGRLVVMTVAFGALGASSVRTIDFDLEMGMTSIPKCACSLGAQFFFLGSRLGHSVLVRRRLTSVAAAAPFIGGGGATDKDLLEEAEHSGAMPSHDPTPGKEAPSSANAEANEDEIERQLFSDTFVGEDGASGGPRLVLTIADKLPNLGPIQDTTQIQLPGGPHNPGGSVCTAACVGAGKHGGLAILSQDVLFERLLRVDLPDVTFLQTVHHAPHATASTSACGGDEGGNVGGGGDISRKESEGYHAYLILSTASSTLILETKEELEVVTDRVDFIVDSPTLAAGNVFGRSRVLQICPTGARLMEGAKTAQDVTLEELAPGMADVQIAQACICDPYAVVLFTNGAIALVAGDPKTLSLSVTPMPPTMSEGCKDARVFRACSIFRNGPPSPYPSPSSSHEIALCDVHGNLEVYTVPSFARVFRANGVGEGRAWVPSAPELVDGGLKADASSVVQIVCRGGSLGGSEGESGGGSGGGGGGLGGRGEGSPLMVLLTDDGQLHAYRMAAKPGCPRRLVRQPIADETRASNVPAAEGTAAATFPSRRLIPFDGVSGKGLCGFFVTGAAPQMMFLDRGRLRVHGASQDGGITAFTPFHNVNCRRGFVFATSKGHLNVCRIKDANTHVGMSCFVEHIPMRMTVHKITYSREAKVVAVLVSRMAPYRKRKPEEAGGDAHATNVYAASETAAATCGAELTYEVRLLSVGGAWDTLWTFTLEPAEVGLCVQFVPIRNHTSQAMVPMLALGTANPKGEDYPCRGRIVFFRIAKRDVRNELGEVRSQWGGNVVTTKDFRGTPGGGGVHCLGGLDGYLLASVGLKVLVFKWNGEEPPPTPPGYPPTPQLEQVGFFDSSCGTFCIATMKRYVVSGDSGGRGGMHFLRWVDGGAGGGVQPAQQPAQASQKVLELLSRDFSKPPTDHVQFLVDGSTLTLVGVDAWGNVRTYAFDPQDPQSLRGKRLIAKGAIWTGGAVTGVYRCRGKAPQQVGVMVSTAAGGLGVLMPLEEGDFRRLQGLGRAMIKRIPQPAGLNPQRYRSPRGPPRVGDASKVPATVIDGDLVSRYLQLSKDQQRALARSIGSKPKRVRDTLVMNM